jgi:chromosome partitioning protein
MIIAISNQKGGTGKTTTTISLAGAFGEMGRQVLVVDLDPQANATLHSGLSPEAQTETIWTALQLAGQPRNVSLGEEDLRDILDGMWETPLLDISQVPIIHRPNGNPYDIVPSEIGLSEADRVLASSVSRERRLASVLEAVQADYDYVLIDCPPHLGVLTINALTAAEGVIVPLEAAYFASKGMNQLFRVVIEVKQSQNLRLKVIGVLLTKLDRRTTHSQQISVEAREALSKRVRVFETEVPVNVDLADASASGTCVTMHSPRSRGAEAYRQLAQEIEAINGKEAYRRY